MLTLNQRLNLASQHGLFTPSPWETPTRLKFADYTPDLPALSGGSNRVKNAYPYGPNNFKQFKNISEVSDAMDARGQGGIAVQDSSGFTYHYFGNASKLYRMVGTTMTDFSQTGGYSVSSDEHWEFVRVGANILACCINEAVQYQVIGADDAFGDRFTSTLKPKARHAGHFARFLVIGNLDEGGTLYPNRIRWSGINDDADMDQDADTQSDYRDLESSTGGSSWVQKIIGREYGIVFQEHSIWRMDYVGSPTVFYLQEVETQRGAFVPGGVIPLGRFVFYIAEDGFHVFDGHQSTPIGHGKIDQTFRNELDDAYKLRITASIDYKNKAIVWAYPTSSATNGNPDRLLIYAWKEGRWTFAEPTGGVEILIPSLARGVSLDDLDAYGDLDSITDSLDSRRWTGGATTFAAIDSANKYAEFTGSALTAEIDTQEGQLFAGQIAVPDSLRPLVEGSSATITAQIGSRTRLNDANSFGAVASQETNGLIPVRDQNKADRYHRARIIIAGGFDDAHGVEVNATPQGAI